MPKVIFELPDSEARIEVCGDPGDVIMQLAVDNRIDGIDGQCGGGCACATCHVHVAPQWFDKVGPPHDLEAEMLEFDGNVTEFSRLACQLELTDQLDGIVLKVVGR
ncbi:2Fe-2S iron-sulfur cluster-binding protein [Mycobacterium sp. CVI_P3]|uniref:2Fe-2S iron-sulfur cluster-binding protein n=2 Tax=Mycobacterium pinniadriaticum TaxID=2994102 RepID=A0ABT3SC79_9MYCO|nr:2Fe-2S iron-sulfur cluster-binding protein [Mycobacterium pinniadriaticum]MCX2930670.1 2Fe-2S iron-sulfur cluster-binding protein [Mycobacterium pinniadriaticum]MCX2937094.1 2Fe-2S iron-sulfur cluster-binding protein [Mycobacterium pinniadriaticum]